MFWQQSETNLAPTHLYVPGAVCFLGRVRLSQSKQTFLEYCAKVEVIVPYSVHLVFAFSFGPPYGTSIA